MPDSGSGPEREGYFIRIDGDPDRMIDVDICDVIHEHYNVEAVPLDRTAAPVMAIARGMLSEASQDVGWDDLDEGPRKFYIARAGRLWRAAMRALDSEGVAHG